MIEYTQGNLLEADVEALVNTVNTVGVMGKGIALMFKEAFPENFAAYEAACKRQEVVTGCMFVTERDGTMAMHPLVPDLVGKSAASVKDPTGATPIAELSAIAVQSGEGFVSYVWPHPNTNNNEPKLEFVGHEAAVNAAAFLDDGRMTVEQLNINRVDIALKVVDCKEEGFA